MVVTFDIYFPNVRKGERLIRYKLEPDAFWNRWIGVDGGWRATPPLMIINSGRWSQHEGKVFLNDMEWVLWRRMLGPKAVAVLEDVPDKVERGDHGPGRLRKWGAPQTFPSEEFEWKVSSLDWKDSL